MVRPGRWLRVVWYAIDDPLQEGLRMQKVKEAWKAVVALAVPVLFGAAATIFSGFGEWLGTQDGIWVGVLVGAVNAIAVWLKRNAQPT